MGKAKISPFEILKWVFATIIVIALGVIGVLCHTGGYYNAPICSVIMILIAACLIVGTIMSIINKKRFLNGPDKENLQNELLAQRERAEEIAAEKIKVMKKLIKVIDICSVAVLIGVCIILFCFFAVVGPQGSGIAPAAIIGVYAGLFFIRPRKVKINENKSEDYLKESEYPVIYGAARRAAKTIGCEGKIKIFVSHDFNAGIMLISDGYCVNLGSYILDNMSLEELYNILLHEFSHVEKKNDEINEILNYAVLSQENEGFGLGNLPYIYFNARFIYEFFAYQYVCSLMNEDAADAAMRKYGNPEIAASMLIKLKFAELYRWERNTYDEENIFEPENLIEDCARRPLRWFKERMELRREDWIKMIDSEIISRNATHSTTKMRIENLGLTEARLVPETTDAEYTAEVNRAILHLEQITYNTLKASYSQLREQEYLRNKNVIDEWEKEGKPITKENYQDILISLFQLLKITEFVNLCCQIIEIIPEPANYFAYHMYGIYLLRCYDERGLDYLYKSIELNHNNWDEALQTIGEYACIVGKQDQLDKYRAKVEKMIRAQIDVYDKMNLISPRDKIIEEKLPDGMLEDFLNYVKGIDDGVVGKIYMVRKVISDEHFVTCVIVEPKKKVEMQKFADLMSKVFQYLDKSSDWEFALFDIRSLPAVRFKSVKNSCVYDAKKKK